MNKSETKYCEKCGRPVSEPHCGYGRSWDESPYGRWLSRTTNLSGHNPNAWERVDLQLIEDALFMAQAVDADKERAERMRLAGEKIHNLIRGRVDE